MHPCTLHILLLFTEVSASDIFFVWNNVALKPILTARKATILEPQKACKAYLFKGQKQFLKRIYFNVFLE